MSAVFDVVVVVVIILVAGCFVKADARHGGRLSVTAVDEPQGIATMLHIFFVFFGFVVVELCGVVVRICLFVFGFVKFFFVRASPKANQSDFRRKQTDSMPKENVKI